MAILLLSLPSAGIVGTHRHAQLEANFAEDYLESAQLSLLHRQRDFLGITWKACMGEGRIALG